MNCRTQKLQDLGILDSPQGSKRFYFITKTIHFAHLDILFIYGWGYRRRINIEEK